ncbi:hypothetical protein RIF29_34287 [Crotalaria pallida]|uniref:Uncharacterized protein n=1 Tax=Crotalaria pallida TaxID=3830 RepID=A0AAN9EB02_CROPI
MIARCLERILTVTDFFQRLCNQDSSCAHVIADDDFCCKLFLDSNGGSSLSVQNRDIHAELLKKAKRLNKLKEKDPRFSKFLEIYEAKIEQTKDEGTRGFVEANEVKDEWTT